MESPSRAGGDAGKLAAGAALGALIMYLFDPERGAARRAASGQRLRKLGRQAGQLATELAVGSAVSHHRHADPDGSFQHARSGDRPGMTPRSSQPRRGMARNAAMAGGSLLALYGALAPRSRVAAALGLAGAAMAAGSSGSRPGSLLARTSSRAHPVTVEKTVRIGAPVEQVYDLFASYDNFPRFLSSVVEVRDLGQNRSHWVVKGPGGAGFTWDSLLTEHQRPRRLAWESEPGAEVAQHGSIDFEPIRDSTRVTVRLSYRPPAGAVGQALASLLGSDPGHQLESGLQRMKQLVERGELRQLQQGTAASPAVLH